MKHSISAFLLLAILVLIGCEKSTQPNELVVGMDLTYPPFETIDEKGAPRGVSVDLAFALGQYLGRPVRIENIPFIGLIESLKTDRVDCVISSMTDTPERRETIDFSEPYLSIGLALLVGKNSSIQSRSDLDQPGKTIAVRQGTTGQTWANANIKKAKILALDKENAAVLEVIQGRADAFIYDQMSVWTNWRKNSETTVAILQPLQKEHWAVAVRKNDDALRLQVNDFLTIFRQRNGFENLGDKYLEEQKEAFREKGIPFYF